MPSSNYSAKQAEPTTSALQSQEKWCYRPGLAIDIKFGMLKYDCRFHGICKLDVDEGDFSSPWTPRCDRAKGWLCIPQSCYCLICFDKESLTEAEAAVYFNRNYFELPEPVSFSEALGRRIGRRGYLLPGRYRIQDKGSRYGVLFRFGLH